MDSKVDCGNVAWMLTATFDEAHKLPEYVFIAFQGTLADITPVHRAHGVGAYLVGKRIGCGREALAANTTVTPMGARKW